MKYALQSSQCQLAVIFSSWCFFLHQNTMNNIFYYLKNLTNFGQYQEFQSSELDSSDENLEKKKKKRNIWQKKLRKLVLERITKSMLTMRKLFSCII